MVPEDIDGRWEYHTFLRGTGERVAALFRAPIEPIGVVERATAHT